MEALGALEVSLVVALAGAGTMTVELAAVRLLAPWFGASSVVWTNVIGVILLSLAVGYLAGARLSCRGSSTRRLGLVLLAAGLATAWLPFLARPVAEVFLPSGMALDEAAALLVWGSLAAALVLFLPAAAVLGCVGPLAVEVLQRRRGGHAGDAGGRILCASTLGSLAGTFATTHVFVPQVGLRWTFLGAALVLAALGLWVLARAGRVRAAQAALGAAVLAALLAPQGVRPSREGERLLAAVESPYQTLRVVEWGTGAELRRRLEVNEGFDSFQSLWQPEPGLLGAGHYYDLFALPAHWSRARSSWRVLILGLGAGTAVRVLEGTLPAGVALDSTGIEIDPEVVALGEAHFDLAAADGRRVVAGADARAVLRASPERFDQIVLDTYANNMEVPAHLATVEFFRELRAHLAPGGWLSVNAAGFGQGDPVVRAIAGTLAAAFEQRVLLVRVPFARNCALYAREGGALPEPGTPEWSIADPRVAALSAPLELPGAWTWVEPPARRADVLTDDRSPIERLQLASIAAGRARWVAER